jgi:GAF domain-containing protein
MNTPANLHDFLFNDRPGEDHGQRAEILVSLAMGILGTLLPLLVYRTPITVMASVVTNVVALFIFSQALRAKYGYLILFPVAASSLLCLVTVVEGDGSHDLLWMGNLGILLLAAIQNRKNPVSVILLAITMVAAFALTGIAEINGTLENRLNTTPQYIFQYSFSFALIMTAIVVIFQRHYSLLQIEKERRSEQIINNRELQEANQALEEQVELRTRELNETNEQLLQRTSRLQTISEISQEISSHATLQLHELLDEIVQSVSEKLNFYHVGIFLLDENNEYAVLRASNSPGGKRMLERRHQLKVGGAGIVGYVSQAGTPRISLDTGSDVVFANNPDLPKTRSEMAIPLKYGSQMIGVLDIQSTTPSAFKNEDTNLLNTLASQIAIAINYMQGNQQAESKSPKRNGIRQTPRSKKQFGYSFQSDGTISTEIPVNNQIMEKALESGEITMEAHPSSNSPSTLAVPVKFRDQVIGIIHIEAAETNRKWTEDEITVVQSISERAAYALENARLFEETSRRAKQEETIAHLTSQIGASTDFNRILQTTVEELGRTLGTTRTFIQLETSSEDNNARSHEPATD